MNIMKKKLSEVEIMDYLDGTLDATRREEVAAFLHDNEDDALEIADMKLAIGALKDWDESDPIRVSDDFWPKLRDRLPEQPQRSWFRSLAAQATALLVPNRSPLRLSIGAAMIAMFLAMAVFLSGPQQTVHHSEALTTEETAFVKKAVERHTNFVDSQPLSSSMPLPVGDSRSADSDEEDGESYSP